MPSKCGLCQLVIFLFSVKFSTVTCDTFYIVTSPSSPCPGEYIGVPCLTLQEYASNPSRSQNVTLLVEPGLYNITAVLTISDGYNFTMSSTNAIVICTSLTAQLVFNRVENVHIHGISLQRCRSKAIRMLYVTNARIVRSNFTDNQASHGDTISSGSGGCLDIASSSVTISESVFHNNRAYYRGGAIYASSSTVIISRSQFSFNTRRYYWGYGGDAIYAAYSYLKVDRSIFTRNQKSGRYGDGGAIYSVGTILQVNNSIFTNNRACSGGAIYMRGGRLSLNITQSHFINNIASDNGGAIYKSGTNDYIMIDGSSYNNNVADSLGGAVYAVGTNTSIRVATSTFINNQAITNGGGAIYSNGQYANITLTSSIFHNNSASYCSVLDVDNYNHFSVNLTNSIFTYNTASGQTIGGGVACIRNASINIIDSTFKHNFANHHAGVFYIDESHTTVDGSLFINNSAALDGGVFYTYVHASDYIIRRSQY